jgi:cystine transport system ATP-binding protein
VAIARALAMSPRVLLCDEPTSALDPELATEVVEVLGKLAGEGTTMVIATHDLRLASRVADHVIFLEAGRIVEQGPAGRIFGTAEQERTRRFVSSISAAVQSGYGEGI